MFTKGWKKPFDERLHQAMVQTTSDLTQEFAAWTGFTQSDEITLIFPPSNEKREILYSGRLTKLSSLTSSFASVRFYHHLLDLVHNQKAFGSNEDKLVEKILNGKAYFDSRAFNIPSEDEVANNLVWRSSLDGRRNSVSSLGQAHFSQKQLEGLPNRHIILKLQEIKGINWYSMPSPFKYGTVIKRELFQKETWNPKEKKKTTVLRSKMVPKSFELTFDNVKEFVLKKYWNEEMYEKNNNLDEQ